MSDGTISLSADQSSLGASPESLVCPLPATSPEEAAGFLEMIGGGQGTSGSALGGSLRMMHMGGQMPGLRAEYESLVQGLISEVEARRAAGRPAREIAE